MGKSQKGGERGERERAREIVEGRRWDGMARDRMEGEKGTTYVISITSSK